MYVDAGEVELTCGCGQSTTLRAESYASRLCREIYGWICPGCRVVAVESARASAADIDWAELRAALVAGGGPVRH